MKRPFRFIAIFLLPLLSVMSLKAQDLDIRQEGIIPEKKSHNFLQWCREHNVANHLDAGISIGSMGVGLELKTTLTKWVDIRAGVDWLPRFKAPLSFNLNTYGVGGAATGNFQNVATLLYDLTGLQIDETVHMTGKAQMLNFKFLVDVYPIPSNRHWRVTAGFFAGTSEIATAMNNYSEKPTLVALNIYNRAYEYFTNPNLDIYDIPIGGGAFLSPEKARQLQEKFSAYGRMGVHIGDFQDGSPYILEPAPDGTLSAKGYVNRFKPYLGAGYSTVLDKQGRWNLGVDVGALFWGGAPDIINHDYATGRDVNFTKDLKNIRGKVGDYMKIIKGLPVYPVLSVRISYSIL